MVTYTSAVAFVRGQHLVVYGARPFLEDYLFLEWGDPNRRSVVVSYVGVEALTFNRCSFGSSLVTLCVMTHCGRASRLL